MKTTEEIREHIKNLCVARHLSLREVSLAIGKESSYLFQYIKKGVPKHLPIQTAQKLAIVLEVPVQDIMDVDLEAIRTAEDIVRIDVIDVSACCGNGQEVSTETVIGQQLMTRNALRQYTFSPPESIKIIRAVGDSMLPTINPNDIVWVDISTKTPSSDGLYLLRVGNDLLIKRIQIDPFTNQATIKSDNPAYASFVRPSYTEVPVVGKIIYHMKRIT